MVIGESSEAKVLRQLAAGGTLDGGLHVLGGGVDVPAELEHGETWVWPCELLGVICVRPGISDS